MTILNVISTWKRLHRTRCAHWHEPKTTDDGGERGGRGGGEVRPLWRVRERQFLAFFIFFFRRKRALLIFYSSLAEAQCTLVDRFIMKPFPTLFLAKNYFWESVCVVRERRRLMPKRFVSFERPMGGRKTAKKWIAIPRQTVTRGAESRSKLQRPFLATPSYFWRKILFRSERFSRFN